MATRCQILSVKCTKFDFGWGSAPDPLAVFKGPTSKGGEDREGRKWKVDVGIGVRRRREGEGPTSKGREGIGGKGRGKGEEGRGEGEGKGGA